MGEYNYSPAFLKAHEPLVRTLVALAKEGTAAEARFGDFNEAKAYRNLILNLKRSLAMNEPTMVFVHNVLRTSVDRSLEGEWIIKIGPAELIGNHRGKVRGRAEQMVQPHAPIPNSTVTIGQVLQMEEILGMGELVKLGELLLGRPGSPTEAKILIPPPQEGIDYISRAYNEVTQLGFEIVATSPHLLLKVVHKQNTSANDALASR